MGIMNIDDYTEQAIRSAAGALLWQASDAGDHGNGFPMAEAGDYTDQAADLISDEVTAFIADNWELLTSAGVTPDMAGHDLILTANGHGTGFWDRGLGNAGDKLTEATRGYSFDAEFRLWENDADGEEHMSDELAWLMVGNTVLLDDLGWSA